MSSYNESETERLLKIIKDKTGMDLSYRNDTVKVSTVYIKKGIKYLSNAGYQDLPSNAYINKQITGVGGTSIAIENDINYVIVVPNVRLIKNKLEKHSNIIPLYGDVSNKEFKEMLDSFVGAKKIMVTYDSVKRLCELINPKDYKILIDEAHQLVNLGLFRKGAVSNVLNNFRRFREFVFMTATPNSFKFFPVELKGVEFIDFKWGDAVKVEFPVQRIKTKGHHYLINHCLEHLRGEKEGNLHIFINSVDTIIDMIKRLRKYDVYSDDLIKIVCSDNEYNSSKLSKSLTTLFNETSLRVPKKINWYTSCCWCGSDIMDENGKTLIYVDNKLSNTKVCVKTQVPQIIGRIRDSKYKDDILMLLVGDIEELKEPDEDAWFQKVLGDFLKSYSRYELYQQYKQDEFGEKVVKDMVNNSYADPYLIYDKYDDDLSYNVNGILAEMEKFSIIHSQYWRLNNGNTPQEDSLYIACATDDRIVSPIDGVDKATLNMKVSYQKMIKNYIDALSADDKDTIAEIDRIMPECKEHTRLLGVDKIKALDYRATKIRDLYDVAKLKEKHKEDIIKILDLEIGKSYTVNFLKARFKEVYSQFGIKERVSMSNADYFFDTKNTQARINGKQQRVVKIEGLKL